MTYTVGQEFYSSYQSKWYRVISTNPFITVPILKKVNNDLKFGVRVKPLTIGTYIETKEFPFTSNVDVTYNHLDTVLKEYFNKNVFSIYAPYISTDIPLTYREFDSFVLDTSLLANNTSNYNTKPFFSKPLITNYILPFMRYSDMFKDSFFLEESLGFDYDSVYTLGLNNITSTKIIKPITTGEFFTYSGLVNFTAVNDTDLRLLPFRSDVSYISPNLTEYYFKGNLNTYFSQEPIPTFNPVELIPQPPLLRNTVKQHQNVMLSSDGIRLDREPEFVNVDITDFFSTDLMVENYYITMFRKYLTTFSSCVNYSGILDRNVSVPISKIYYPTVSKSPISDVSDEFKFVTMALGKTVSEYLSSYNPITLHYLDYSPIGHSPFVKTSLFNSMLSVETFEIYYEPLKYRFASFSKFGVFNLEATNNFNADFKGETFFIYPQLPNTPNQSKLNFFNTLYETFTPTSIKSTPVETINSGDVGSSFTESEVSIRDTSIVNSLLLYNMFEIKCINT